MGMFLLEVPKHITISTQIRKLKKVSHSGKSMGNVNSDLSAILGGKREKFSRSYLERLGLERSKRREEIKSSYHVYNGMPQK